MVEVRWISFSILAPLVALSINIGGPRPASAAPITFFGEDLGLGEATPLAAFPNATAARNSFLSNLSGGVGTENFEGFANGTVAPLVLNFPGSTGGITATLGGGGNVANVTPGTTNGVGRYATSGSQYWETSAVFTITFGSPVAAFGFFGIDIGDFNGQVTVTTAGGLNQVFNIPNTVNGLGGSVLFFGVIDPTNTFTSVAFGNTQAGVDFFGFDDMTIGDPQQVAVEAPEPTTLSLLGLGLIGLGVAARRRRKVSLPR